jgi:thioredoxin-like negative regulator of GroEL
MADHAEILKRAAALSKSGHRTQARHLISQVLEEDPQNVTALWGLASITRDVNERHTMLLRILDIQPNNPRVKDALEKLYTQNPEQAVKMPHGRSIVNRGQALQRFPDVLMESLRSKRTDAARRSCLRLRCCLRQSTP